MFLIDSTKMPKTNTFAGKDGIGGTTHKYGDKKTSQSGHEGTGGQGTTDRKQEALKESNLTDQNKKKKGPVSYNPKNK